MNLGTFTPFALPLAMLLTGLPGCSQVTAGGSGWDAKSAAGYLDRRMEWWISWPKSARDHDTYCVSCHTAVPYALARHTLRTRLAESGPPAPERALLANVEKRVGIWKEAEPFYSDKDRGAGKTYESRGTESVLNALILVTAGGSDKLTGQARAALANMWEQQIKTGDAAGGFPWLDFHNRPFEADDSPYYGAALAAIAVGSAPADYRANTDVARNLETLRGYLKREFARQSSVNRMVGLWADAKIAGILTPEQKSALLDEIFGLQQADGGWSLTSLAGTWKRHDDTPLPTKSDGYATGLVTLVLEQTADPKRLAGLKRGLTWLAANQKTGEGLWPAWSLNKERDEASELGHLMTDVSTSYAVMALTGAEPHGSPTPWQQTAK